MAKIMTIRPPDNLQQALKKKAHQQGYTVNALVIQILWNWIKNEEKKSE